MKVAKDSVETAIIEENDVAYIYRSVTQYDEYQDTVEYSVNMHSGETVGRYESIEDARKKYQAV